MATPEHAMLRVAAGGGGARPAEQEAIALLEKIARYDQQIGQLEAELRALPLELARLSGHPVLWLLLGREGIDRPGGEWSALVGQQVVIAQQTSWRLLLLVAAVMLMIGFAAGAALVRLNI